MEINAEKTNNENLEETIPVTNDDKSETSGECGIFQVFG
jgi:hypothetical protein